MMSLKTLQKLEVMGFAILSLVFGSIGLIKFTLGTMSIVGLFFMILVGGMCLILAEVIRIRLMLSKITEDIF